MADPRFGDNAADRISAIVLWRTIAMGVAILGWVLAGLVFLVVRSGEGAPPLLVLALAAWPPLVMLAGLLSGGRLWLAGSGRSTSILAISAPFPPMMLIIAAFPWPYVSTAAAFEVGATLSILVAALGAGFFAITIPRRRLKAAVTGALLGAIYGAGLLGVIDMKFDFATPKVEAWTVRALKRHHSRYGFAYSASLIHPDFDETISVGLTPSQYRMLRDGDEVRLLQHAGRLGVPWREVMVSRQTPRAAWLGEAAPMR